MTKLKFPQFEDYPEGFNWFAYDENGEAHFYKEKPYIKYETWNSDYSGFTRTDTLQSEQAQVNPDQINPDYYKWHPVTECINIIQEFPTNLGMSIKYLWRVASPNARKYDSKEERIQDLKKAIRCIEFEIERIKTE